MRFNFRYLRTSHDLSFMQFDPLEEDTPMEESNVPVMPVPSTDRELYSPQELKLMAWIQK